MSDIEANLTVKLHVSDVILMMMNLKRILEQVEWTIRERMNWVNYAQLQQCEKAKQILDFSSEQILDFSPQEISGWQLRCVLPGRLEILGSAFQHHFRLSDNADALKLNLGDFP